MDSLTLLQTWLSHRNMQPESPALICVIGQGYSVDTSADKPFNRKEETRGRPV